jgi:pyruvate/2-oxoglutarate dehydrogenase complex dihydrolipoamide acyltransferase (E2) component
MPNLGMEMDEAKLVAWLKRVGEPVLRGEALADIETDKTTVEMEALVSGTLVEICAEAGDVVRIGATIAWIESE